MIFHLSLVSGSRDAQILFEEEIDLFSDFDEDIGESVEGLESRAMKGLEELHEHDKKVLALLKSRSKVVESLRTEKPYYWTSNSFEGKDRVLGALSEAVTVRILRQMFDFLATLTVTVDNFFRKFKSLSKIWMSIQMRSTGVRVV